MYSGVSLGNEDDYPVIGGAEEWQQPQSGRGRVGGEHVSVISGISAYHLFDTSYLCLMIGAGLSSACLLGPLRP